MSSNQEKATDAKAPVKADEPVDKSDKKDAPSDSKRDAQGSRPRRARKPRPQTAPEEPSASVRKYQPKLMTDENEEEKTVLIKISRATTVRQVINYSIGKIKSDWKVTLNAFQMEIAKVLVAAEIVKTRLPFLHQENKLITFSGKTEVKSKDEDTGEEKVEEKTNIRSGIQVTLSRNQFEVTDPAGYQKPKPRQFLQPLPSRPKYKADEKENFKPQKDDTKKSQSKKNRKKPGKQQVDRAESYDERDDSDQKNRKGPSKKGEEKKQGVRRDNKKEQPQKSRQDKRHGSYSDERYRADEYDRYDPMPRTQQRRAGGPPQKKFDSDQDYEQRYPKSSGGGRYGQSGDRRQVDRRQGGDDRRPGGDDRRQGGEYQRPHEYKRRGSSIEFERPRDAPEHYYRGGPPPMYGRDGPHSGPPPRYEPRYPPSRGGMRGRGGPPSRGGGHMGSRDFETPHRPGYYAGNRPFRMDKIRDQPLETLHSRAADQIERDRADRAKRSFQHREMRDTRNKPQSSHHKE